MRSIPFLLIATILASTTFAAPTWKAAESPLRTPWADRVDPANVLPE